MSKVYIATTTLNFNNILSTESISPISFYQNRSFGYKRFESVEPNNFDDVTIAYSNIPNFDIQDEGLDSYPMILELSKDFLGSIEKIGSYKNTEIFKIPKTIYLHPNELKFFFLSEEHKKITLIKSQSSIETKLIPLYRKKILVINKSECFKWEKGYLENVTKHQLDSIDFKDYVLFDKKINCIKGFFYSYILGEVYCDIESRSKVNKTIASNNIQRNDALQSNDYKTILEINHSENKIIGKMNNGSIKSYKNIFIANNNITSLGEKIQAELYKNIINDVSLFDINNANDFKSKRFELLKVIGDNFKELTQIDDKVKNKIIEYIRALLKNIKNYEPFEIDSIKSDEYHIFLKSIAYFILKGDDLEKLLNALIEDSFKTFKISIGLWGAVFGFAAIPKTIFNKLFNSDIDTFLDTQDFLHTMYKKIHGIDNIDFINIQQASSSIIKAENDMLASCNPQDIQEPKCPKCGANMILREPKEGGKYFSKGYGCTQYIETKCSGWVDYTEHHKCNTQNTKETKSLVSKIVDPVRNLSHSDVSSNDLLYKYLAENGSKKISEVKQILHCKNIAEFEDKVKNDTRFEISKKKPKMVLIKDS